MQVAGQMCGISVMHVRDVIATQAMTRIPLAPPEIAGSLNLRGHIVTAIDLRRRLRIDDRAPGEPSMSVVVEWQGELYSLVVDSVGDVLTLHSREVEPAPETLPGTLRDVSDGIHRLETTLMLVLNTASLLSIH